MRPHRTATASHTLPNRLRFSAFGLRCSSLARTMAWHEATPARAGVKISSARSGIVGFQIVSVQFLVQILSSEVTQPIVATFVFFQQSVFR